jgi:sulfate adenylyltransferase
MAKPQGFTLFMTGLPSAGKTTLAGALRDAVEKLGRAVTVLDGDVVREMLSSGLTFSRADRELNIRRIGYVAGEVTRHGGVCVCAAIAPFASARAEARERIAGFGGFYEIYVSTPLAVCETRDTKGLYRRARRGELRGMTGIDDPFEVPASPDVAVDTSKLTPAQAVERILALPRRDGVLPKA